MHGITNSDGCVVVGKPAWHDLATVIPEAVRPTEALPLFNAEWTVEQLPLVATDGDRQARYPVDSHVLNIRSDNRQPLGIVGRGYQAIQNRELAEYAEQIGSFGEVKIESAATLFGGRKVFFLLRGESFFLPGDDEVRPYLGLFNTHDGTSTLRGLPTSIRVVCDNTWRMAFSRAAKGEGFSIRHSGDLQAKLDEAKRCIEAFRRGRQRAVEVAEALAKRQLASMKEMGEFFARCYGEAFEVIPSEAEATVNSRAAKRRQKALNAWSEVYQRWDTEAQKFGPTAWVAANAFSGWVQHSKVRGRDNAARAERRVASNLFGLNADRSAVAFDNALSLCS